MSFFNVGAAAATAVGMGTLGAAGPAQAAAPAPTATAAPAAVAAVACDQSDAIVIGASSYWYRNYPYQEGNLGTLRVKYSPSCNTEWAQLELNAALPSGTSARAQYNHGSISACNVAVGGTSCTTTPRPVICGTGQANATGFKDTVDAVRWYVGGNGVTGVHC
ncbi:hypothetical protein [Frankia sp. EI5c]|uniref:hypothetical protein n=1 Tax=Frankia sp. EI5c TaxID=683316 RepID=UPI000FF891CD|nr:hypothetical protein [Frankia sp. EI5c]